MYGVADRTSVANRSWDARAASAPWAEARHLARPPRPAAAECPTTSPLAGTDSIVIASSTRRRTDRREQLEPLHLATDQRGAGAFGDLQGLLDGSGRLGVRRAEGAACLRDGPLPRQEQRRASAPAGGDGRVAAATAASWSPAARAV